MATKVTWYCRWCGTVYCPSEITERDEFCCEACKQTHKAAYALVKTIIKHLKDLPKPGVGFNGTTLGVKND